MIPIGDVIPSRTTGHVSRVLTLANAIAAVLQPSLALPLAANAIALWIFGENVEDRMGHVRFLVFAIVCGAISIVVQRTIDAASLVAYASSAAAGVAGAYFVLYPRSRVVMLVPLPFALTTFELSALVLLAAWVLVQMASASAVPSWGAGFVAGAALVFVFRRADRLRVEWWNERPR